MLASLLALLVSLLLVGLAATTGCALSAWWLVPRTK